MAKVTNIISKILSDFTSTDLAVNSALKYRFSYNGHNTDVFYTVNDGLQRQLLLAIVVNSVAYITTLEFTHAGNDYYMNFYLPNELYEKIKFSLLYVNGHCFVKPYFEQMSDYIISHQPIAVKHRELLRKYSAYKYQSVLENPYFKTIKRVPMSRNVQEKILKKYDKRLAEQILNFCGSTHTLVFTSNIEDSRDIEAYIYTHSM